MTWIWDLDLGLGIGLGLDNSALYPISMGRFQKPSIIKSGEFSTSLTLSLGRVRVKVKSDNVTKYDVFIF